MGNIQLDEKMHFGYKYINSYKELEYLKTQLTSRYDPEYLPKQKSKKQLNIKQVEDQFSDSDIEGDD